MIDAAKKNKLTLVIGARLNQRLDFQAAINRLNPDGLVKGDDRSSIVEGLVNAYISLPESVDAILTRPAEDMPSGGHHTEDGPREKTTFYLSPAAARRLQLHATWTGEDRSMTVERLIRSWVTPWDFYDPREKFVSSRRKESARASDGVNPSAASAA